MGNLNSKIKVSGNILRELSEKIPSNLIAINELIKNSYDAGANNISIILNSNNNSLTIEDDGEGMDIDNIHSLFHISKSNKIYGKLNKKYNRYIQGSKGLGFLSVFKFGESVKWQTKKDIGYYFSVDFKSLTSLNDLSTQSIQLIEDNKIKKGTTITVSMSKNKYECLKQYFSKEEIYKKVLYCFNDNKVKITLKIDSNEYKNTNTNFHNICSDKQVYNVKYSSKFNKINFYYKSILLFSEDFKFNSSKYFLNVDLVLYNLHSGDRKKFDKLYINSNQELTPLIYVNNNLFNNYDLFKPGAMRSIQSKQSMPQIIGEISIISDDPLIDFNSDRTNFVQNELTDSIKDFLFDLNRTIQKFGSAHKKDVIDFDILKDNYNLSDYHEIDEAILRDLIKDDIIFKNIININFLDNKIIFSLGNKKKELDIPDNSKVIGLKEFNVEDANKVSNNKNVLDITNISKVTDLKTSSLEKINKNLSSSEDSSTQIEMPLAPAKIKLYTKQKNISIPSGQINLLDYIEYVSNSMQALIDKKNISVSIDGVKSDTGILESINTQKKVKVEFSYNDELTGNVSNSIILNFYEKSSPLKGTNNSNCKLINIPAKESYTITYNDFIIDLINELNNLSIYNNTCVISCSLRSLLDVSVDCINKSQKYNDLLTGISSFEERVLKIVDFIISNKKHLSEISKSTKIDFHSLSNLLNCNKFKSAISIAHLGAHKGTTYISKTDIESLASICSIFVVIVNEMINNEKIK